MKKPLTNLYDLMEYLQSKESQRTLDDELHEVTMKVMNLFLEKKVLKDLNATQFKEVYEPLKELLGKNILITL